MKSPVSRMLGLGMLAAGCGAPSERAAGSAAACDSVRAARVALDSLRRVDPFPSDVYRFERDSLGMRIVTWPTPDEGGERLDGMSVVRIDRKCLITELIQSDSA